MCFSVEADLVAAAVMVPLGVWSLSEVREAREAPYAALPLLFGLHQLVEAVVWGGGTGAQAAAVAYVVFALPFLPAFVPGAVWLLDRARRRWIAPAWAVGIVVSVVMLVAIVRNGVGVREEPHALVYEVGLPVPALLTVLYVAVVMVACLVSVYPGVKLFGLLNLVGLSVVAVAYTQAFASLWCGYAALASLVVVVHMRERRGLRDQLGGALPTPAG